MENICTDVSLIKDESIFASFEKKYGFVLEDNFKLFFKINNGGIPKRLNFEIDNDEYELRCFLSFNEGEYNSIQLPLETFQRETKGKIIPFAKDSGDNYYCLNVDNSKVYFWSVDDGLYYCLAETFSEFTEFLK